MYRNQDISLSYYRQTERVTKEMQGKGLHSFFYFFIAHIFKYLKKVNLVILLILFFSNFY